MDVTLSLLADGANVTSDGKLNLLGAFDRLLASTFPARHPEMQLVLRFSAEPSEVGDEKHITIRTIGEDGERLGEISGDLVVPEPDQPGDQTNIQLVLRLRDTVFPAPGRYRFDVAVAGETKVGVPLRVIELTSPDEDLEGDTANGERSDQ